MVDCFCSNWPFILNACLTQYHTTYLKRQNSIQEKPLILKSCPPTWQTMTESSDHFKLLWHKDMCIVLVQVW